MFTQFMRSDAEPRPVIPKEGQLFKIIELYGKTFEIRYGFYEECDRKNQYAEPVEIYPDFIRQPQYTDEGYPFITAIQNPCQYFHGEKNENSTCEECSFYQHCEELLAICSCPSNKVEITQRQNE